MWMLAWQTCRGPPIARCCRRRRPARTLSPRQPLPRRGRRRSIRRVCCKRSALSIDRVRGLIAQRDAEQKKQAEEQARVEAEAKAAREKAERETAAKKQAEEELRAREIASAKARASARSTSRIAAYALGGVAVAGLATGTIMGLQANSTKGRFTQAETVADKERFAGQTKTNALIADAGFGIGVAAAIAAVLLYPKGDEPHDGPRALLVPHPGGAGLEVSF